jgi:hypothetical protein
LVAGQPLQGTLLLMQPWKQSPSACVNISIQCSMRCWFAISYQLNPECLVAWAGCITEDTHRAEHYWINNVGIGAEERGGGDRDLLPNRLTAARVLSWHRWRRGNYCPAAGILCIGTFWIEDATSGSRRDHVSSDATECRAVESGSSGGGGSCCTERSHSDRTGESFVPAPCRP